MRTTPCRRRLSARCAFLGGAVVALAFFLHAMVQPGYALPPADPGPAHAAFDNCDGGPSGCKALVFVQVVAGGVVLDTEADPPQPFERPAPDGGNTRYEAPSSVIDRPPVFASL